MLIVITGPTGVGKTTVASRLVKEFALAVHIDLDTIKHFVVTGFQYNASDIGAKQWRLLGRNAAQLIRNFLAEGYTVVVNGMVSQKTWDEIFKTNQADLKILLGSDQEINMKRDAGRTEEAQMGAEAVLEHQKHFSESDYYADFKIMETSKHSVDETVGEILKLTKPLDHLN